MRMSDWSSDVCSSDLIGIIGVLDQHSRHTGLPKCGKAGLLALIRLSRRDLRDVSKCNRSRRAQRRYAPMPLKQVYGEIGRASGRESVCQDVSVTGDAGSYQKKIYRHNKWISSL